MMFRAESTKHDSQMTISIAGRLERRHLADLNEQCTGVQAAGTTVALNLSGLQSADKDAIQWLSSWIARGEQVAGESPYVRILLERAQASDR